MKKKRFSSAMLNILLLVGLCSAGLPVYAATGSATSSDGYSYTYDSASMTCTITAYSGAETVVNVPSSVSGYAVTALQGQFRDGLFYGVFNSDISCVVLPNSVISIGKNAFYNCTGLTSVTIPNSVTSIGVSAFSNCSSLTAVTIPNNVTSLGNSAFVGAGLTSITIPSSVTSIQDYTFYSCKRLTSVTIPNGVTSIGSQAFMSCIKLTNVTIPNSVTSIGICAFDTCKALTGIEIPSSVTAMGSGAFENCENLADVTISSGVAALPSNAFWGCSQLTSVTIPSSVTLIGTGAFYNCSSLANVYFDGSTPPSIGTNAFSGCSGVLKYYVPSGYAGSYSSLGSSVSASTTNSILVASPISNGTITPSTTDAMQNETVTLSIAPNAGYTMTSGSLKYNNGVADTAISGTSFSMPSVAVTVSAAFEPVGLPSFTTSSESSTKLEKPTWTFQTSADGKNSGYYRYQLDSSSTWSYNSATGYTPSSALSDGSHTLTLEEMNKAGDWSSAVSCSLIIDATPPAAPTITTNAQTITGTSITITGNAEPNSTVLISGGASTATCTVNGSGAYSVDVTLSTNSVNSLSVTATDAVGNVSPSATVAITNDSIAPAAPTITTGLQSVSNSSITITGTAELGSTVAISGGISTVTGTADPITGIYSISVPLTVNTVNYLSVTAADAVGNTSTSATVCITQYTASTTYISPSTYSVSATQSIGGMIALSASSVTSNGEMTVKVTPESGYRVSDVCINGVSVGAVTSYTIKNITLAVTVTAKYEKLSDSGDTIVWSNPFTDVTADEWFYDSVKFVCENGLMKGVTQDQFDVGSTMDRGMFVTILFRYNGDTSDIYTNQFADVPSDAWFENAVAWAASNGIVNGKSSSTFGANDNLTREQLAVMLYQFAKFNGIDVSTTENAELSGYNDSGCISVWASDAIKWAVENGILQGYNGLLNPQAPATRGEGAAIIQRFLVNVLGAKM
jgi:hypothetical protein